MSGRKLSSRRGRRAIDAYLVECLDCSRRYRLTDRTCPGCGSSVDKAFPLYLRIAATVLAAAVLAGCVGVQSPTEPTGPKSSAKTDCPLDQKDMYGFCIPPQPPTPTPTPTVHP